jgi:DNA-directed RNA polymerase specialized sigma24 family protein
MNVDITATLGNWTRADPDAREAVFAQLHAALSGIAARQLGGERSGDVLLEPGMLVNEAFLKLADLDSMTWQGRAHFLATAARIMRQVLLDHARRRSSQKRDGGVQVQLMLAGAEGGALPWRALHRGDCGGARRVAAHGEAGVDVGACMACLVRRAGRLKAPTCHPGSTPRSPPR